MIDLSTGTISKITTLADGCLRVTLDCREMSELDMLTLLTAYKKGDEGVLIPEITVTEEDGGKSPAQRLRGCIFKYWEMNTSKSEEFEVFYRKYYEKLINNVKDKLNT